MKLFYGRAEWWSEVEGRKDSGSGTAIHSHQNENACGRAIYWLLHWLYLGKWIAPPPPPPASHTPLLPVCISWLIGFLRQWRSVMKKAVHGKCLGICSDVWQNESVRPCKWECHKHGGGVSSTWWRLIGWGVEVIFASGLGIFCCQQNFSHLLVLERKWAQMKICKHNRYFSVAMC